MSGTSLYGFDKQFGQHLAQANYTSVPVNTTQSIMLLSVPVGFGRIRIESLNWVSNVVLSDTDGTILLSITARDVSEGADDVLVSGISLEGGVAMVPAQIAFSAETAEKELTLEEGDSLRATIVNNSAAIDTNGIVGITVGYHSIPKEAAGDDIKRATFYTQL